MPNIDQRLLDVFRFVFENDALAISDETSQSTLDDWDSFAQAKLLVGLEDEFGVEFESAEVGSLKSVAAIKQALVARSVSSGV